MSSQDDTIDQCEKCQNHYTDIKNKWCKQCQIDNFKKKFTNWTSGNERIDDFIQERQLKIEYCDSIVFEWIPYNQFNDIKEIYKDDFETVYSAIWIDGPLNYDKDKKVYKRNQNEKVFLRCFHDSQNLISEFLDEVRNFSLNLIKYLLLIIFFNILIV